MSERDRKLAAKYAARGKPSATETARNRERSRSSRGGGSTSEGTAMDAMDAMRAAAAQPRDAASYDRARAHQRSASDGSGGESYADRSAKSTTKWSGWRRS